MSTGFDQDRLATMAAELFSPPLNNPKVEYYTSEYDDKVQIFSKVDTSFGGPAHNFVAEKDTMEEAEDLIQRLKQLSR